MKNVLAVLAVLVLAAALAAPASAGTLTLDLNLASVHSAAWARRELNQRNPGLGLTYRLDRDWAVSAGGYENSYRRPTFYALGRWTPLHIGDSSGWHADLGLTGGLASGYRRHGRWVSASAPIPPCSAPSGLSCQQGYVLPPPRWIAPEVPTAPFVAGGFLRLAAPSGASMQLIAAPGAGKGKSGFIGLQVSTPIR